MFFFIMVSIYTHMKRICMCLATNTPVGCQYIQGLGRQVLELELELTDPNSTCLDGHDIGVWKLVSFPRGIGFN